MSGKVKRGKKGRKPQPKPAFVPSEAQESGLSQADANAILRAVSVPAPISAADALAVVGLIAARVTRPKARNTR